MHAVSDMIYYFRKIQTKTRNKKTKESDTYLDASRLRQRREVYFREKIVLCDLCVFLESDRVLYMCRR